MWLNIKKLFQKKAKTCRCMHNQDEHYGRLVKRGEGACFHRGEDNHIDCPCLKYEEQS